MSATYYPIVAHGGIPNVVNAHGGITAKRLVRDTRVGKRAVQHMPHLIANTVDNLARGIVYKPLETQGDPSLIAGGKARKLVKSTKVAMTKPTPMTEEEKTERMLNKMVNKFKHAL
jgi:hypothetical protein